MGTDPAEAPAFVADAEGMFRAAGIDLTVVTFSSGAAAFEAARSARAGFVVSGDLPSMKNWALGDMVGIAPFNWIPKNISVLAEHGIKVPQDLEGKRVGVTLGATHQIFFQIYLQQNHIPPSKVQIVNLAPADMPAALLRNDIQAYVASRPAIVTGLRSVQGAHLLQEGSYPYLTDVSVLSASRSMSLSDRVAVVRALYRADQFFASHRGEAERIVAKRLNAPYEFIRDDLQAIDYHADETYDRRFVQHMTTVSMWAVKLGMMQKPVDLGRQFDLRPLREVSREVGKNLVAVP